MLGRSAAVWLVALATAGLAGGCTSDSSDADVMRVTLSGDGCRYEGSTTVASGTFAVDVRNDTNEPATFALVRLPQDAKLEDVETSFDQALRTWQTTGRFVLRRPLSWLTSAHLGPHSASELPFNMFRRARLALLCTRGSGRPFPFEVIAAAELDVRPDG